MIIGILYYPIRWGKSWYGIKKDTPFQYDAVLGYSFKPNHKYKKVGAKRNFWVDHRTNKQGFSFTEDITEIEKSKLKMIFCIGGSTTASAEVAHDKKWPTILDIYCIKHKYRVINAGVPGYRSIHEKLLFEKKILSYNPEIIIIYSGLNDFQAQFITKNKDLNDPFNHFFLHTIPTSRWQWLLQNSSLIHSTRKLLYLVSRNTPKVKRNKYQLVDIKNALDNPVWIEFWKKNICEIIELCHKKNIICFLLSHCLPVFKHATDYEKKLADEKIYMNSAFDHYLQFQKVINNEAKEICIRRNAVYLDTITEFENFC